MEKLRGPFRIVVEPKNEIIVNSPLFVAVGNRNERYASPHALGEHGSATTPYKWRRIDDALWHCSFSYRFQLDDEAVQTHFRNGKHVFPAVHQPALVKDMFVTRANFVVDALGKTVPVAVKCVARKQQAQVIIVHAWQMDGYHYWRVSRSCPPSFIKLLGTLVTNILAPKILQTHGVYDCALHTGMSQRWWNLQFALLKATAAQFQGIISNAHVNLLVWMKLTTFCCSLFLHDCYCQAILCLPNCLFNMAYSWIFHHE
jgi:hypothetical protein